MLIIYGHRLGLSVPPWPGFEGLFRPPRKSAGQKSGVRTDALKMVLDHDSGHMDGRCLKGRFAGRAWLPGVELLLLLEEISATDPQGAALWRPISTAAVEGGANAAREATQERSRGTRVTAQAT